MRDEQGMKSQIVSQLTALLTSTIGGFFREYIMSMECKQTGVMQKTLA